MNKAENIVKRAFYKKSLFTKNEIKDLLNTNNLSSNDNALRQLIYKLTKAGVLQSPRRGLYTTQVKPKFEAQEDAFLTKIRRLFVANFSELEYCIWSTNWLNNFMIHQPFTHFYIFETESDVIDSVFHLFSDNKKKTFLNPSEIVLDKYVSQADSPIILEKLPGRSPVRKYRNAIYPKPEKILVDIFCNQTVFYFYQGSELVNIYSNITSKFHINYTTLFAYAEMRGKKEEIKTFIKENLQINPVILK